jgi:uncharacterized protein with beta-barrel porin domain
VVSVVSSLRSCDRLRSCGLAFAASLAGAVAFAPSTAFALCTPPSGNNVTVTCSGTTSDQGPGSNTGYGDGTQSGITVNVQAPATVTGTSTGIDVGGNNTINNLGVITTHGSGGVGDVWGINANGANLTVINSGTIGRFDIPGFVFDAAGINALNTGLSVTNQAGGTIQGTIAIQGAGTGVVVNSGLITGLTTFGGGEGIDYAANNTSVVTVTNNQGGVITGDAFGINANSAVVTNSGTISAPTSGGGGTGLNANTLVLTNNASGQITGDAFGVAGSQTPNLTITNLGTISSTGFGGTAISGNVVNIMNTGTITAGSGIAGTAVGMGSGNISNNTGGTISGDSGIVASGNTSIFNAGTITGSGGLAISFAAGGNTLTLGPGSVITGTAHGFGADTFQLGGVGTDSFNAALLLTQYSGYATFNKIGASTWTLTGTNATAMPWTVQAGTLLVNGALPNSTMTVSAGATLGGNGTVGTTTINGGTLSPGNSIGTLNVQGNLVFTAASSYLVEVSPASADRTNVTGTATLGGATVNATFAAGTYVSKQYTIVNATGGVSGTFSTLVNTNLPSGFTPSLSYDANDAFLNLTLNFTPTPTAPNFGDGLNRNQQSVANALINFFNTTGGIPIVFGTLTPAGLTQLSGETATGAQQTTFDAMNLFMGVLTDPFINGRGDIASAGGNASGYADPALAYTASGKPRSKGERDAYAAMARKAPPLAAPPFEQRWSVWAAGYGGSRKVDGDVFVGSNTITSDVYGTAVGADYRVSPDTLAGFALGGAGTNFHLDNNLGSGHSDMFQAGAFVRHTIGPAYIAGALAYGWQDITTDRPVTVAGIDQLRARFDANALSGRAEAGYRFVVPVLDGFGLTPYGAGQFTTFWLPAYAEAATSGANTFALAYGAKSVTDSRSELGFRTDKSYALQGAILTFRGREAWLHDYDPDRSIGASFLTLPSAAFSVTGARQPADALLSTASAEIKWLNGWSLEGWIETESARHLSSYAGKGVVRYQW